MFSVREDFTDKNSHILQIIYLFINKIFYKAGVMYRSLHTLVIETNISQTNIFSKNFQKIGQLSVFNLEDLRRINVEGI